MSERQWKEVKWSGAHALFKAQTPGIWEFRPMWWESSVSKRSWESGFLGEISLFFLISPFFLVCFPLYRLSLPASLKRKALCLSRKTTKFHQATQTAATWEVDKVNSYTNIKTSENSAILVSCAFSWVEFDASVKILCKGFYY